ncbi:sialic acid-binding Ig-like lectin 10 isoform X1 [Eleginops maclovinus]|uniref:sialic acid-binding Ig-like lectin 10 isoform X1 n=1 Tax=Eleginops maclovinus TaxID=56733 RepID=UPI0030807FAE
MSFPAAARGLVVLLLSMQGVTGQNGDAVICTYRYICAPKGSSENISCIYNTYHLYGGSKLWFRHESYSDWLTSSPVDLSEDSQYEGRIQVLETERRRSTLRISDLRDSDSAEYRFTFKTSGFDWRRSLPGTTLTVTALQVQVITVSVNQSDTFAELKCHSSCLSASYVWFKSGEKITTTNNNTYIYSYKGQLNHKDNITCAFKGHEDFPSPPVYSPRLPSVSVSPSAGIKEGSSVTLTCSSDANPALNYTWYKENEDSHLPPFSEGPQLVFSSFQPSLDSGQYYCAAENILGRRTSEHIFIDVGYKSTMILNITRLTLVVVMLIPLLLFCLWMRKKKAVSSTTEPNDPMETVELDSGPYYINASDRNMVSAAQTEEPEEQEQV